MSNARPLLPQEEDEFNVNSLCKNVEDIIYENALKARKPISQSREE